MYDESYLDHLIDQAKDLIPQIQEELKKRHSAKIDFKVMSGHGQEGYFVMLVPVDREVTLSPTELKTLSEKFGEWSRDTLSLRQSGKEDLDSRFITLVPIPKPPINTSYRVTPA